MGTKYNSKGEDLLKRAMKRVQPQVYHPTIINTSLVDLC